MNIYITDTGETYKLTMREWYEPDGGWSPCELFSDLCECYALDYPVKTPGVRDCQAEMSSHDFQGVIDHIEEHVERYNAHDYFCDFVDPFVGDDVLEEVFKNVPFMSFEYELIMPRTR